MLLSDKYPFLTNYFTTVLNSDKHPIPQSLLFYGNDLASQYVLAKEIARLLNCKKEKADDCDCINCKWINEHAHPAVLTYSRIDNKPDDDESKTVISIKQSQAIKESLINSSEFHRVYIFCDKDDDGNIKGLNQNNFQPETANSLLKIIEEPQPGVTFIFLTRYVEDVLSTIISRSQCFFVPSKESINYNYEIIEKTFDNYWNFERKDIFNISQKLQDLTQEYTTLEILNSIQNLTLTALKNNPKNKNFIEDIKNIEDAKKQAILGIKSSNLFDNLCLKLIK